jgi:F0F1-type ATP synthase alpha subunit
MAKLSSLVRANFKKVIETSLEKYKSYNFRGRVITIGDGIAEVAGLYKVQSGEMVEFSPSQITGLALNLDKEKVGIVLFGSDREIKENDVVKCVGKLLSTPVGYGFLSRTVDPLGNPLDGLGSIDSQEIKHMDIKAPGIPARQSVYEPVTTGLKAVDSLVPIGRGQRELIIGDGCVDGIRMRVSGLNRPTRHEGNSAEHGIHLKASGLETTEM